MKDRNLSSVLHLIRKAAPITRRQIEAAMQLSWGAVSNATALLLREGYIKEVKCEGASTPGRTPVALAINGEDHFLFGLDVNRSGLRGVVMNLCGEVLYSIIREPTATTKEEWIGAILSLTRELYAFSGARSVLAMGVAMQGAVDAERGVSASFPATGWQDVPLAALLSEKLALPVYLEHDPDCILYATAGERELSEGALLRVDRGIGMAVMLEGEIFKRFGAFEIGRTPAGEHGEPLEQLVTEAGLATAAGRPFADLVAAARAGDAQALEHFRCMARRLGTALAHVAQLLHINEFLLCGRMLEERELFLEELIATAARLVPERELHISLTRVENAAIGAAMLAAERHMISFD